MSKKSRNERCRDTHLYVDGCKVPQGSVKVVLDGRPVTVVNGSGEMAALAKERPYVPGQGTTVEDPGSATYLLGAGRRASVPEPPGSETYIHLKELEKLRLAQGAETFPCTVTTGDGMVTATLDPRLAEGDGRDALDAKTPPAPALVSETLRNLPLLGRKAQSYGYARTAVQIWMEQNPEALGKLVSGELDAALAAPLLRYGGGEIAKRLLESHRGSLDAAAVDGADPDRESTPAVALLVELAARREALMMSGRSEDDGEALAELDRFLAETGAALERSGGDLSALKLSGGYDSATDKYDMSLEELGATRPEALRRAGVSTERIRELAGPYEERHGDPTALVRALEIASAAELAGTDGVLAAVQKRFVDYNSDAATALLLAVKNSDEGVRVALRAPVRDALVSGEVPVPIASWSVERTGELLGTLYIDPEQYTDTVERGRAYALVAGQYGVNEATTCVSFEENLPEGRRRLCVRRLQRQGLPVEEFVFELSDGTLGAMVDHIEDPDGVARAKYGMRR